MLSGNGFVLGNVALHWLLDSRRTPLANASSIRDFRP